MIAGVIIADQVLASTIKVPFTVAKKSSEFVTLSIVYFWMSIATSLMTTSLIIFRILQVQRMSPESGSHRRFRPAIEIIVESAILYSVTLIIFTALDVIKTSNVFFAQNIHAQMAVRNTLSIYSIPMLTCHNQGIAPLLITLRVGAGFARPQEEWTSVNYSGDIQFAPSSSTFADSIGRDTSSESKNA